MAWDELSLDNLDQTTVETAQETLIQLVENKVTTLDARRGALRGSLISPMSLLSVAQQELAERLSNAQSLLKISQDTTLGDSDLIDSLLSNYRITRRAASKATGELLLVFSSLASVSIPSGTVFYTEDNVEFATTQLVRGKTTSSNVITDYDVLITSLFDGSYGLVVPVEAVVAGSTGNIERDTELDTDETISGTPTIYAVDDFTGGAAAETTSELLTKLAAGISTQTFSSRGTLLGFLRSDTQLANVLAVSAVGAGDVEMTRDQRGLLPISQGGKTDIYLKSTSVPEHTAVTVTAELVGDAEASPSPEPSPTPDASPTPSPSPDAEYGTWEFTLDSAVRGFYEIVSVKQTTATATDTGYTVTSFTRGITTDWDYYLPDVETVLEATFSPLQTATVQFTDTDTDITGLTVGSTRQYEVVVSRTPLVEEAQIFLASRANRPPVADILVKAAIPCFVELDFDVSIPAGSVALDEASIKSALSDYVGAKAFGASLTSSEVAAVVIPYLPSGASISNILLTGRTLLPDDSEYVEGPGASLSATDESDVFATSRTIALFLRTSDIEIDATVTELEE